MPASHITSYWQRLPDRQSSKLCQEPWASVRRLQTCLSHTMCTLHFRLQVSGQPHCAHTRRPSPRESNHHGLPACNSGVERAMSCFVSSFSKWIILASLPSNPCLNLLFGEGGEDYSLETEVKRAKQLEQGLDRSGSCQNPASIFFHVGPQRLLMVDAEPTKSLCTYRVALSRFGFPWHPFLVFCWRSSLLQILHWFS